MGSISTRLAVSQAGWTYPTDDVGVRAAVPGARRITRLVVRDCSGSEPAARGERDEVAGDATRLQPQPSCSCSAMEEWTASGFVEPGRATGERETALTVCRY